MDEQRADIDHARSLTRISLPHHLVSVPITADVSPNSVYAGTPSVRLDIWLWAARFFKTRSLAKAAIEGGRVDCNDAPAKPAKPVHVGDTLRIGRGEETFVVAIAALSEQRGPASVAHSLYIETDASRAARDAARELQRLQGRNAPAKKPDKRARRLIRALGDIDAL